MSSLGTIDIIAGIALLITALALSATIISKRLGFNRRPISPQRYQLDSVCRDYKGVYFVQFRLQESRLIEVMFDQAPPAIYCDVPPDEPIWALLDRVQDRKGNTYFSGSGDIHLHSANEIRIGAAGDDPADDCPAIIVV